MRIGQKIMLSLDMLRALCRLRRCRAADGVERIAVFRLDGFGDLALFLPAALALREAFPRPRHHLTLAVDARWLGAAQRLLDYDDFIPVEIGRYMADRRYRRELNRTIAERRFNRVLQPRFFREPFLEDRLTLAAGCGGTAFAVTPAHLQHRIAKFLEKRLYDTRIEVQTALHESAKNRRFLDAVGASLTGERPDLPPPPEPWRHGEYMVLLPGSGKGAQGALPPERWGSALADVPGKIAVAGSAGERELVFSAAASLGGRAKPLAGTLSAVEFCGLLAHAAMVVGNDTGGIHFAAWCGVPAFAVAGGGHPGCYYPYPEEGVPDHVLPPHFVTAECSYAGCRWRCRRGAVGVFPCVAGVAAKTVAAEVRRLLAEHPLR